MDAMPGNAERSMMMKSLMVLALGALPLVGHAQAILTSAAPPGQTRPTPPTQGPTPQPLQAMVTVGRLEVTGTYAPPVPLASTITVGTLMVTGNANIAAPVALPAVIAAGQLIVTVDRP
jgi:hypothetical protein